MSTGWNGWMRFHSRSIDPVAFWQRYVDFPAGTKADDTFAPKVQCPNPDHDTLKKHFQVNFSEPKVHCFAHCGISGSYEHAVAVIEGLYEKFGVDVAGIGAIFDKHPAKRTADDRDQLARRGRALRKAKKLILAAAPVGSNFQNEPGVRKKSRNRRPTEALPASALSYERYLPPLAADYLEGRRISDSSVAKWELGWDADSKRLVIPARDLDGRLRFLIKRGLLQQQQPKYLYTEGFPKTALLFGACSIDLGLVHSNGLIVVEGSVDTIRFHQHGLTNTGGILGTGISDEQVKIIMKLRPPRIILAFDRDPAGIVNIEIAARKLRKYPLYVMRYTNGKEDPADLTRREAITQIGRSVPLALFNRDIARTSNRRKVIHG